MNTTREFLAAVKRRHGLTSDYQLAKFLGMSKQRISANQAGAVMTDTAALKVADALELDRVHVLACIAAERASNDEVKKTWMRAAAATAAVILAVHFALTGDTDSAFQVIAFAPAAMPTSYTLYALALLALAAILAGAALQIRRKFPDANCQAGPTPAGAHRRLL